MSFSTDLFTTGGGHIKETDKGLLLAQVVKGHTAALLLLSRHSCQQLNGGGSEFSAKPKGPQLGSRCLGVTSHRRHGELMHLLGGSPQWATRPKQSSEGPGAVCQAWQWEKWRLARRPGALPPVVLAHLARGSARLQ